MIAGWELAARGTENSGSEADDDYDALSHAIEGSEDEEKTAALNKLPPHQGERPYKRKTGTDLLTPFAARVKMPKVSLPYFCKSGAIRKSSSAERDEKLEPLGPEVRLEEKIQDESMDSIISDKVAIDFSLYAKKNKRTKKNQRF